MCNFCSAFLSALMHNEMQIDEALLGGESGMSPDTTSWRHYQSVRALGPGGDSAEPWTDRDYCAAAKWVYSVVGVLEGAGHYFRQTPLTWLL